MSIDRSLGLIKTVALLGFFALLGCAVGLLLRLFPSDVPPPDLGVRDPPATATGRGLLKKGRGETR